MKIHMNQYSVFAHCDFLQLLLLHHMCVILQACEPAAKLALEDVNAKSDLLPGYTLRLHWNDSGVSIFQSLCIFVVH